jgi:hypothetical protein
LRHVRFGHSDKHTAAHSDKLSAFVRTARRFLAPSATCLMVRLA